MKQSIFPKLFKQTKKNWSVLESTLSVKRPKPRAIFGDNYFATYSIYFVIWGVLSFFSQWILLFLFSQSIIHFIYIEIYCPRYDLFFVYYIILPFGHFVIICLNSPAVLFGFFWLDSPRKRGLVVLLFVFLIFLCVNILSLIGRLRVSLVICLFISFVHISAGLVDLFLINVSKNVQILYPKCAYLIVIYLIPLLMWGLLLFFVLACCGGWLFFAP